MAGRIKRFFKRNMNFPKGFGRKAAAKGGQGRAAEYTRGEQLQESQLDIAAPLAITDNTTQSELIFGVGDLSTDSGAGNTRLRAKLHRLHASLTFSMEEGVTDNCSFAFYVWLMKCSLAVNTDWTANSRHPYLGGLQQVANACPFTILSKVVRRQMEANTDNEFMTHTTAWVNARKSFTCQFPDQIYLMWHLQIINDGSVAGIAATQLRYSTRYGAKVYRPNII